MSKPISTFTPVTDLQLIRESLKHCEEVTLPYRFTKDMWVKYITVVDEDEAFFEGGYFSGMGDHIIILCNKKCNRRIPTCIRSDDGEVLYKTRFFVDTRKKPRVKKNIGPRGYNSITANSYSENFGTNQVVRRPITSNRMRQL